MIRRSAAALLVLALFAMPAPAKQVLAMLDEAAGRPARLEPGRLHRLLLSDIEPGDRVHILLATAANGDAPASLVTLIRFRAHARPAIRNAQLLAAASALAQWRRSEASHDAPEQPGALAPLLIRTLREHAEPANALRLTVAGRLTPTPPPDRAALRAALPSTAVVTLVDLATPPSEDADQGEANADGDAGAAEGEGETEAGSTLAEWRTALAAAGARWQPAPGERP